MTQYSETSSRVLRRGYGSDANFMLRFHSAGAIKISNPQEVRRKLIPRSKMNAICNYFGNNRTWYYMLMDGDNNSAGATSVNKPADDTAVLMLYNNEQEDKNGVRWVNGWNVWDIRLQMYNVMQKNKTEEKIELNGVLNPDEDDHKWVVYNSPNQFYAAIVERNF